MVDSIHVTVLPRETVDAVAEIRPSVVIDGTFGGGGHTRELIRVQRSDPLWPTLRVIGIDRDPEVAARFSDQAFDDGVEVYVGSYEQAGKAIQASGLRSADAMILDLGLSSDQLADRRRGFSFNADGPLDLRFDPENGVSASDWMLNQSEADIADAIYQFGEERYSRRIARAIKQRQLQRQPVRSVVELAEICRRCVPRSKNHDIHPATRTFQALRIAVNDELSILQRTLDQAARWIRPGGRIAVISFHSLEDRIVKTSLRQDPRWESLTKKPIRPGDAEVAANPRSRSAKLRVAQRTNDP